MKICPNCEEEFCSRKRTQIYCSRRCAWDNNGGHNKKAQGWWKNSRGYIEGRVWDGEAQRRVKQHRWIMEQYLGRRLKPTEIVHHRNEVRDDNRLENLEVIDYGAHSVYHNRRRIYCKGYRLNLTNEERKARSERAKTMGLAAMGRAAIAATKGEQQ